MAAEPVTAVEAYRHERRWRLYTLLIVVAVLIVLALLALIAGAVLLSRIKENEAPTYASIEEHFKYGSIGSEPSNGIPYWIWKVLPSLYPEEFDHRQDYAAFGFLYETDEDGNQRDLPIGISRRNVSGVDVVWLNCATCHTGTWREAADQPRHIVLAMPSNNLDFHRFVRMVLRAAVDERLAPAKLFPAMEAAGADLGPIDRLIWRVGVLPRFREGLLQVRSGLQPLLDTQPPWGPGRVDTFNPYKVIQFDVPPERLTPEERAGVADLPAVFNQNPREGMNLHWDGNNAVLRERNLSAAIGAGVTPDTVDHAAIERVADWLGDLQPPPSPHRPDPAAIVRGAEIYSQACASCHGWQSDVGYVFEGELIGQVDPIASLGTDRGRLDSYTEWFRELQLERLFAGTRYHFRHFKKTDGYANLPLDGLWLRGPYLHNGSVPTLADLLKPPEERPKAFRRGSDVVDSVNGGFESPLCNPAEPSPAGFCFDTSLPGNGSGGHLYGV
ncbi:MAG TPA: cytochrome c, partial [Propylenella sp.]|nr:cytochrome c [Propylenella sp.]